MKQLLYKHYKGGLYVKIGNSNHTETGEKLVIYKDNYGTIHARPYDMFYGKVKVDGKEINRFELMGEW